MICCDKCSAKIVMGESRRVSVSVTQGLPEVGARNIYTEDFVYAPRIIEGLCDECKKDFAVRVGALLDEFGAEPLPEPVPKEPAACEA